MSAALTKISGKAVATPVKMIPYGDFEELTKRAQHLIEAHNRIKEALQPKRAAEAQRNVNYLEGSGMARDFAGRSEKLDAEMAEFGDAMYDDATGSIARSAVTQRLARLLGSFPVSNIPNSVAFAGALLEEVLVATPSPMSLETACRKLVRTLKFVPSIKETLDALADAEKFWAAAYEAINCIEDDFRELKEITAKAEGARR